MTQGRQQRIAAACAVLIASLVLCGCGGGPAVAVRTTPGQADTVRLQALMDSANNAVRRGDATNGAAFAREALRAARALGMREGGSEAMRLLGRARERANDVDSAMVCFRSAIAIADSADLQVAKAKALTNLGLLERSRGQYEEALEHLLACARIMEAHGDTLEVARTEHNISELYYRLGDLPKALASEQDALARYRRMGDAARTSNALCNLGYLLVLAKRPDTALIVLKGSVRSGDSVSVSGPVLKPRVNLALAYDALGLADSTMATNVYALRLAGEQGDLFTRIVLLNNIGEDLLKTGRVEEAGRNFRESLDLADSLGSLEDAMIAHGALAAYFERKGDLRAALAEERLHKSLSDSLMNDQRQSTMAETMVRYESEKKDRENEQLRTRMMAGELEQQRYRSWALLAIAALVIVVLAAFLFVGTVRQRERQRRLELEQQALRLQMDPHFLFNALNTIPGLYASADVRTAKNYVEHLADLLRSILETSRRPLVPLRSELEVLEHYLAVSVMRHPGHFTYTIIVYPEVDKDRVLVPPMLLQPLVENAIQHGLLPGPPGGAVRVEIVRQGLELVCRVLDNGIGREASGRSTARRLGDHLGLAVTEERIRKFNRGRGRIPGLRILDLSDAQGRAMGTEVVVRLHHMRDAS